MDEKNSNDDIDNSNIFMLQNRACTKKIAFYKTEKRILPCQAWLNSLDEKSKNKTLAYITRVASGGSKKNIRALGNGVFEIKINYGPGLRVYFGEIENLMILLLIGGSKQSQFQDIQQAKLYWRDYETK